MTRKKFLLLTLAFLLLISFTMVLGIDYLKGTVFNSEVGGGNITFAWDFTAYNTTFDSNQVRFAEFNYTHEWEYLGFRAPANGHMNVTQVNTTHIILDTTIMASPIDYEIYVYDKGAPSGVTGVVSWSHLVDTVYFRVNANTTVTLEWGGPQYNITLKSIYSETEAGFYTLLYGNCTRAGGANDGANVTFRVNGCTFTWNADTEQYEGTILFATPQTVTFNTLQMIASSEYTGETGLVIEPYAVVTWTTGTIDLMMSYLMNGNWVGAITLILFNDITAVGGWTLIMAIFSIGIYNYSGPYATFAVWILGWGMFSTQVHGLALTLSIIMLVLGLGIALAKLWLDRRTS